MPDRRALRDRREQLRGGRRMTDKIACPSCGCLQSSVVPSHPTIEQQQTGGYWRRRACGGCGRIFQTEEIVRAVDEKDAASSSSCTVQVEPLPS